MAYRQGWTCVLVLALLAGCGSAVTPASGDAAAAKSSTSPDPAAATQAPVGGSADTSMRWAVVGSVRDAAGHPVTGVLVSVTALDGAPSVPELAVLTDRRGAYRWPSLQPGRYELSVHAPAGSAAGRVSVPQAGTATLDLTLAP